MKKDKGEIFRFVERCLYEYPDAMGRLERLRFDLRTLSSCTVQNYGSDGPTSGHSDRVWAYVQKVSDLEEEIASLERRTAPITRLLCDLEEPYIKNGSPLVDLSTVLKLVYFGKVTRDEAIKALKMSKWQLYKTRQELVKKAIYYMGF